MISLALTACLISGCGTLPAFDPRHIEERSVSSPTNSAQTLTLKEAEVWYDTNPPTAGIRFPEGIYAVEAEDDTFRYFRAPALIEMRSFKGTNASGRTTSGGIALRKSFDALGVAAEGYVDDDRTKDATKKLLIWKLGSDFQRLEGTKWTKSF